MLTVLQQLIFRMKTGCFVRPYPNKNIVCTVISSVLLLFVESDISYAKFQQLGEECTDTYTFG